MLYSSLAEIYSELDATTLKLKKTDILANFLEKTPPEEIENVILLCMGRAFPEWSEKELGLASLLMVRGIAKAYGVSEKQIEAGWKKAGDLGLVAEQFSDVKRQKALFSSKLTVDKVVSNLRKIAEMSGPSSQERKIGLVGELLISTTPKEAKYIVRTVIGDLRIGVAEGIIRDAIARAFFASVKWSALLGTKSNGETYLANILKTSEGKRFIIEDTIYRKIKEDDEKLLLAFEAKNPVKVKSAEKIAEIDSFWKKKIGADFIFVDSAEVGSALAAKIAASIEEAHALTNDYALVAKTAQESGEEGLSKLSLTLFRPIKVMLAQKVETIGEAFETVGKPAAIEYKFDGFRMQIHKDEDKIEIYTRRLERVTNQFPEVVDAARKALRMKSCIVEGEAIGIDKKTGKWLPFQKVSRRIKRKYDIKELAGEIPVVLNLFDVLYINGQSAIKKSFLERRNIIKEHATEIEGKIVLAKQLITDDQKKAESFYKESLSLGNEGVMFKNLSAEYKAGSRVGYMIKLKPVMESLDLTIVGAEWGEGKRAGWLSSFVVACMDEEGNFVSLGRLGTGIKEKTEEGTSFKELTELLKPHITKESGTHVDIAPTVVLEVAYEEIQQSPSYESGYALRFPRLVRMRPDKSLNDVDDINRVRDLYARQKYR